MIKFTITIFGLKSNHKPRGGIPFLGGHMCKDRYCDESGNYDHQDCPDAQKLIDELDKAKHFYEEILDILYSEDKQDMCILEHFLLDLSDVLNVRFPNNKILNIGTKC